MWQGHLGPLEEAFIERYKWCINDICSFFLGHPIDLLDFVFVVGTRDKMEQASSWETDPKGDWYSSRKHKKASVETKSQQD